MKKSLFAILILAGMAVFAGCGQGAKTESGSNDQTYEEKYPEEYVDEEYPDDEYMDEEYYWEEDEYSPYDEEPGYDYGSQESGDTQAKSSDTQAGSEGDAKDGSDAVGIWYTDGYDKDNNWASSYKIELTADGKASCTGWRNQDTGTYTKTGDNKVLITFDYCELDSPEKGLAPVDGFIYTIEMEISGDDARIKIDAPDVISNLDDGTVHRESSGGTSGSTDKGKVPDVADGEYITDEKYSGRITDDGATLTIETALYHYDKDWNTVLDYEKDTYVFPTSGNCKCVVYTETTEESPVAKQVDFINEFLKGNSGLPITFKIKNNQLVEIGFSS